MRGNLVSTGLSNWSWSRAEPAVTPRYFSVRHLDSWWDHSLKLEDGKVLKRKENKFNFGFEMFMVPGISMCEIIRLLSPLAYIYNSFNTSILSYRLNELLLLL